ncbi:unnamed protein product [Vitrella brassicaformis CCMP3155]|uniref:Uncharacterized protein n=1 Tax=Vitrella brassicaformis (strain CCMP3155) TaxID=1169540 RepID=A0A0G4GFX3_VITBC|nr:unnamed protein product [Vitrella brassicaformis CCMP3155]|eukprot:CEM28411.1 unnamed protein product [Vitrella brassicaformis CCMP3155]
MTTEMFSRDRTCSAPSRTPVQPTYSVRFAADGDGAEPSKHRSWPLEHKRGLRVCRFSRWGCSDESLWRRRFRM